MNGKLLRGRPEERFKLSIGFLVGAGAAVPVNVLALTNWQPSPGFGYLLVAVTVGGVAFRKRAFVVGASGAVFFVSLPQAVAAVLPTPLTNWHVSAGVLWLIALAILGCLYLMREAETRTDADIDAWWLFRPQE
jgi:hypothetical protein